MKTLLFINGPMGVGKTAVCRALLARLEPGVWLDGDWCWMMRPFRVTEESRTMVLDNIIALLSRFLRNPELTYIIFDWVMHQPEIAADILSRLELEGVEVQKFTLLCRPDTLRRRLEADAAAGLREPDAVERGLAYLPLYEKQDTDKIMTDNLTPEQVAEAVAAHIKGENL